MIVADVPFVKGFAQRIHHEGIPVPQVKAPTVAAAVDEALIPIDVPNADTLAPAWDEFHPMIIAQPPCLSNRRWPGLVFTWL